MVNSIIHWIICLFLSRLVVASSELSHTVKNLPSTLTHLTHQYTGSPDHLPPSFVKLTTKTIYNKIAPYPFSGSNNSHSNFLSKNNEKNQKDPIAILNTLNEACKHGDERELEILVELHGKEIVNEVIGETGLYPIHVAAEFVDSVSFIKKLVMLGADVNKRTKNKEKATPLYFATMKGNLNTIKALILYGAMLDHAAKDDNVQASYHIIAALHNKMESLKLLVQMGGVNFFYLVECCDETGRTPMSIFASNGHTEQVRELAKMGAKVKHNYTKENIRQPIEKAAENGHFETVKILLNYGVRINPTNALILAAQNGYEEIVTELINAGVDINLELKGMIKNNK